MKGKGATMFSRYWPYQNFAILLAIVLSAYACAVTDVRQAGGVTFNEKAAIAISTVTEVRLMAATLLKEGKISLDDAKNVLLQTDAARAGITVAIEMNKVATNSSLAEDKLATARSLLLVIQTYLNSRK